jgi:hypothetical protein
MASQLTSPYGGGGGFDQTIANILGGEDVDQARGQQAMGMQQAQQQAQAELAQRQRIALMNLLQNQQQMQFDSTEAANRRAADMQRLREEQAFQASQAEMARKFEENVAKRAQDLQLKLELVKVSAAEARAKGQEDEAAAAEAEEAALTAEINDYSSQLVIARGLEGKTATQANQYLDQLLEVAGQTSQTFNEQMQAAEAFAPAVIDEVRAQGKNAAGANVRAFTGARGALALAQGGTFGATLDSLFGPEVNLTDAELEGLAYITLQPGGLPVEGLSPTMETSMALVRGVDSPEVIRQKVISSTAAGIASAFGRMPGIKGFNQDAARATIEEILTSSKSTPEQIQALQSAGIDPLAARVIFNSLAQEMGKDYNATTQALNAALASGGQRSLRTEALAQQAQALQAKRDLLARAGGSINVAGPKDLEAFAAGVRRRITAGNIGGLVDYAQQYAPASMREDTDILVSGLMGGQPGPLPTMQDRQAQIAGLVEQERMKQEELERARARRAARAPFAGMKEEDESPVVVHGPQVWGWVVHAAGGERVPAPWEVGVH